MSSRGALGEVMYVCMHGPTGLHLMTGCRPGEWSACIRSYVDLKHAFLALPASVYKSGHDSADGSELPRDRNWLLSLNLHGTSGLRLGPGQCT